MIWIVEALLLAVGLSMDAFAVSVCKGLGMKKARLKHCAICGVWFGGFQALMPLIGFLIGSLFAEKIQIVDHWIAFGLLVFIGINIQVIYSLLLQWCLRIFRKFQLMQ